MSRWQQVEKLCQAALELEESQRRAFLEEACAGDEELRREVESLLRFDTHRDRFIEEPALEVAAKIMAHEKPELLIGHQLGSYQIVSLLGAGGMGVVYRARHTRLKRSVAVKVLPADKMSDLERKRRFIQEARAASALNHPNIITIHDIGNENGIDFIVMEYVTGRTLDQRIPRKGMRRNEALKLAVQMADTLARAHSTGIIHRDLKPSNVMVTEDGTVKVLDFGLAKLTEISESIEGSTRTLHPQTEEGIIVGTLCYMSPEQAEGKKVDARSDIFSFGAVLYEMVTGQKAFEGDSKLSTLAAIAKQDPKAINQLVPDTPPGLEKIINRCLRKDPGWRFQHMDDLKVELAELREESSSTMPARTSPAVRPARRTWVWAGGAFLFVAAAVAIWLSHGPTRQPAGAPELRPLTSYVGSEQSPNFSPDGNQVVFSWNGEKQDNFDIYVKLIGSPTPTRLTTDPGEDRSPAFSPDGHSIGFLRVSKDHTTFIVIPAIGGPERIVANLPENVYSFSWLPDGKWVVTDGLTLLSTESGETRPLTSPLAGSFPDHSPAVSPDGHTIAFCSGGYNILDFYVFDDIYLVSLTADLKLEREPRRLTSMKSISFSPAWAPTGREIIFTSGVLGTGTGLWRIAASGAGGPQQLPFGVGDGWHPAVSGTGHRLAYQRGQFHMDIWRLSLSAPGVAGGSPSRFIASTRTNMGAQYSPDGKRVAFESDNNGIYGIWVSDTEGNPTELFSRAGTASGTARWSPDGQRIAFDFSREGNISIYVIRASGGEPIPLTSGTAWDVAPSWSRDGKWVYFTSKRSDQFKVWKVSAGGGKAIQVTRNGGGTAFESLDGRFIYYTKGDISGSLWRMSVGGGRESQVLPSVVMRAFSLVNDGIYFIPEPGADRKYCIRFLGFVTDKVKTVAPMSGSPAEGLCVSPDGRSLLFSQLDKAGSDLMLVENFR